MSQLEIAMNTPLLRYSGYNQEARPEKFQSASALFYLMNHGRKNGFEPRVKTRVLQHIRNIITGGREPCMDCQHFWHYPLLSATLTLAKNTPEIWNEFTAGEVSAIDTLMECFVYIANFIANDKNEYRTGLSLRGDVYKGWNANFKISLVAPIVFGAIYFGGSAIIDRMLVNFDYDYMMTKFELYGFDNIKAVWSTPSFEHNGQTLAGARTLMVDGGQAYIREGGNVFKGGSGVGVREPFLYRNYTADDIGLVNFLLEDCYGGGAVFSHTEDNGDGTYDAYILDGTNSPMENQLGQMLEFNGNDKAGIRSDAWYCMIDFNMVVAIISALKELGYWDENNYPYTYSLVKVGNADLIYKLEHGYVSYSLGRQHTVIENNVIGYPMMKEIWQEYFA